MTTSITKGGQGMSQQWKQQYELSVWNDTALNDSFREEKIAVIGGDSLDTPIKAYDVTLKENVNGEKTLTFSLPRKYVDKEGDLKDNPFLSLLTAERKIKLRDGAPYELSGNTEKEIIDSLAEMDDENKWYDFIIKKIEEDKTTYVNKYTCKQIHTTELGKNGYDITLHADLNNNHGNLTDLGEKILRGSNWVIDKEGSDTLVEYTKEPLFFMKVNKVDLWLRQIDGFKVYEDPDNRKTGYGGINGIEGGLTKHPENSDDSQAYYKKITEGFLYFFYSDLTKKSGEWKIDLDKDQGILGDYIQVLYSDHLFTDNDASEDNEIINDRYFLSFKIAKSYFQSAGVCANYTIEMMGSQINYQTNAYNARKVVPGYVQFYEPVGEKFVTKLINKDNPDDVIYEHTGVEYLNVNSVKNYIINSENFVAATGWEYVEDPTKQLECITWADDGFSKNYLIVPNSGSRGTNATLINGSFYEYGETLTEGDRYQCRAKMRIMSFDEEKGIWTKANPEFDNSCEIDFIDKKGNLVTDSVVLNLPKGKDNGAVYEDEDEDYTKHSYWITSKPITVKRDTGLSDQVKVRLSCHGYTTASSQLFIEALEVYPYIECERISYSGKHLEPEAWVIEGKINQGPNIKPTEVPETKIVEKKTYYTVDRNKGYNELATAPNRDNYQAETRVNNEAYRTIEVKQSNYFNNLNNLAELFEMWPVYSIAHSKDGRILLDKNGKPIKKVRFSSSAPGNINHAGFHYGVNTKSIKRSIDSEKIVTKLIVKPNNNEFAEDGICSISTAEDNPVKDNFLFNFDYYINQGLLHPGQVQKDLYGFSSQDLAYYDKIGNIQKKILELNNQIISAEASLQKSEEMKNYCELSEKAAEEELIAAEEDLEFKRDLYKDNNDSKVRAAKQKVELLQTNKNYFAEQFALWESNYALEENRLRGEKYTEDSTKSYQKGEYYYYINKKGLLYWIQMLKTAQEFKISLKDDIPEDSDTARWIGCYEKNGNDILWDTAKYNSYEAEGETLSYTIEDLPKAIQLDYYNHEKDSINQKLYDKYSQYIQEGTWTDEKYLDSNLYYYDAKKVSSQNAFPKVSYTISALETGVIDKNRYYDFQVGDKTYIEDTEFFGYKSVVIDEITYTTPFKKEVIVSERSRNFDDPSKTTITIKTYKNQFEELFSKISATTSSLQYASGGYDRAANAIQPDGTVSADTLAESFAKNALILSLSKDNSVSLNNGIEVRNPKNPSEIVRIVSNGIMMSVDGGLTWINGLTAYGINTHSLTAGTISADKVSIAGGKDNSRFLWTNKGLDAIRSSDVYVRYDQHGLYGVTAGKAIEDAIQGMTFENATEHIEQNATFALTWNGVFLNSQDGATSLTPLGGLEIFNPNWTFDNDIISYEYNLKPYVNENATYQPGEKIPLISIGRFRGSNFTDIADRNAIEYGMRLRNQKGHVTLQTDIGGNLWLRNVLQIGEKPIENHEVLFSPISSNLPDNQEGMLNNSPVSFGITYFYKQEKTENNDIKVYAYLTDDSSDNLSKWEELDSGLSKYSVQFYYQGAEGEKIFFEVKSWNFAEGNSKQLEIIVPANVKIPSEIEVLGAQLVKTSGFFLELTGAPTIYDKDSDGNPDGVILRAGVGIDNTLSNTPFYVTGKGKVVANNAIIRGEIQATKGHFYGQMTIGKDPNAPRAGIGTDSDTIFWAKDESGETKFSVNTDGQIFAKEAKISGLIESDGLYFGTLRTGVINDQGIVFKNGAGTETCAISSNGEFYGDSLFLGRFNRNNSSRDPHDYAIWINHDDDEKSRKTFVIRAQENGATKEVLQVTKDGQLNLNGRMTAGQLLISDKNGPQLIIDGNDGARIYAKKTSESQPSWLIDAEGNATFWNATISGTLSTTHFVKNTTAVLGGRFIITPSFYTQKDYETVDNRLEILLSPGDAEAVKDWPFIEVENSSYAEAEVEIITNNFGEEERSSGKIVRGIVASETGGAIDSYLTEIDDYALTGPVAQGRGYYLVLENSATIPAGSLIRVKDARFNTILFEANAKNGDTPLGPRISMSYDKSSSLAIGSLGGVTTSHFGTLSNSDRGIYLKDAYVEGKLYLPNAGITNEGEEDQSIRFWAGEGPGSKDSAPFRVLQDGTLYASKGVFKGTVEATNGIFSGEIVGAGIKLIDRKNDQGDLGDFFYVTQEKLGQVRPNYLLDIDESGINLFKGGLYAYSQSHEATGSLYGQANTPVENFEDWFKEPSPWPYFSTFDEKINGIPQASVILTDLLIWKGDTPSVPIRINNEGLTFLSPVAAADSRDFKDSIKNLYGTSQIASYSVVDEFLLLNIANGYKIKNNDKDLMTLKNNKMDLAVDLEFESTVKIAREEIGLSFYYLGTTQGDDENGN